VIADGDNDTTLEGVIFGRCSRHAAFVFCRLHGSPVDVRGSLGECPYDEGGYFVVMVKRYFCSLKNAAPLRLWMRHQRTQLTDRI
jgi:hypothetical protein